MHVNLVALALLISTVSCQTSRSIPKYHFLGKEISGPKSEVTDVEKIVSYEDFMKVSPADDLVLQRDAAISSDGSLYWFALVTKKNRVTKGTQSYWAMDQKISLYSWSEKNGLKLIRDRFTKFNPKGVLTLPSKVSKCPAGSPIVFGRVTGKIEKKIDRNQAKCFLESGESVLAPSLTPKGNYVLVSMASNGKILVQGNQLSEKGKLVPNSRTLFELDRSFSLLSRKSQQEMGFDFPAREIVHLSESELIGIGTDFNIKYCRAAKSRWTCQNLNAKMPRYKATLAWDSKNNRLLAGTTALSYNDGSSELASIYSLELDKNDRSKVLKTKRIVSDLHYPMDLVYHGNYAYIVDGYPGTRRSNQIYRIRLNDE